LFRFKNPGSHCIHERKGEREEGDFWKKPREEEKLSRRTIEEEKRSPSGDRQKLSKEFCG